MRFCQSTSNKVLLKDLILASESALEPHSPACALSLSIKRQLSISFLKLLPLLSNGWLVWVQGVFKKFSWLSYSHWWVVLSVRLDQALETIRLLIAHHLHRDRSSQMGALKAGHAGYWLSINLGVLTDTWIDDPCLSISVASDAAKSLHCCLSMDEIFSLYVAEQ